MERSSEEAFNVLDSELDFDSDLFYTYLGKPFSGVGYEDDPVAGRCEISTKMAGRKGRRVNGTRRAPCGEMFDYRENVQHGKHREYREDGSLASEEGYEYGILVYHFRYDENRRIVESYELEQSSPAYAQLLRFREKRAGAD